jgi:hypothetical protein
MPMVGGEFFFIMLVKCGIELLKLSFFSSCCLNVFCIVNDCLCNVCMPGFELYMTICEV